MKRILALALLGLSASAALAQPSAPSPHVYGVMFEVTADKAGKIDDLKVIQVIDTRNRMPMPEMIAQLPRAYVDATRELLRGQTYGPGEHFYTSNFFDPERPTEAKIALPDPD